MNTTFARISQTWITTYSSSINPKTKNYKRFYIHLTTIILPNSANDWTSIHQVFNDFMHWKFGYGRIRHRMPGWGWKTSKFAPTPTHTSILPPSNPHTRRKKIFHYKANHLQLYDICIIQLMYNMLLMIFTKHYKKLILYYLNVPKTELYHCLNTLEAGFPSQCNTTNQHYTIPWPTDDATLSVGISWNSLGNA